jgi:hypothetical protein
MILQVEIRPAVVLGLMCDGVKHVHYQKFYKTWLAIEIKQRKQLARLLHIEIIPGQLALIGNTVQVPAHLVCESAL